MQWRHDTAIQRAAALARRRRNLVRGAPFVGVGVAAVAVQPFDLTRFDAELWWPGLIIAIGGITGLFLLRGLSERRLTAETVSGLVLLAGIAMLRDGAGGSTSGLGQLNLLVVMWFATYARRRQLYVILVAAACALTLPLALVGSPRYPTSGWRGAAVSIAIAMIFGLTTRAMRDALASRNAESVRGAAQLRAVLEAMGDPIARYEIVRAADGSTLDLRCVYQNKSALELEGTDFSGQLLSTRLTVAQRATLLPRWIAVAEDDEPYSYDYRSVTWRPGAIVAVTLTPVAGGLVAAWRDVSDARRQEEALRESQTELVSVAYVAAHDRLTGLLNRGGLEGRLGTSVRVTSTIVYIDLDDFKPINDTYGHAAGDLVLVEIATRLQNAVRAEDLVARLGGDEFVIVVAGTGAVAEHIVDRVRLSVSHPIEVAPGVLVSLRASVGMTDAAIGESSADAIARADLSMYREKLGRS